jgi:Zn finger protein HypA/HybF involved in hydrogenase expression
MVEIIGGIGLAILLAMLVRGVVNAGKCYKCGTKLEHFNVSLFCPKCREWRG